MRAYQETITWLRFKTELRQAPPSFWLILGDCAAGLRHLNGAPLPVAEARSMERELLAAGIHGRLALDGVSLSLDSVQQHVRSPLKSPLKGRGQAEVDALLRGLRVATETKQLLSIDLFRLLHKSVVEGTHDEDRPGQWRLLPTGGAPWEGVPQEVIGVFSEELCDWLGSADLAGPAPDETEAYALLRVLLAELYLAWIRPFGSAHFRFAGLVGITILRSAGMSTTPAHILAIGLQRQTRELQRQIQQASEGNADVIPFMAFALRAMVEVTKEIHARLRDLQTRGQWRAQLLELFQEGNDEPTRRQRQVLLDLAEAASPVPLGQLDSLSPALAKLYAGVSEKTMRRDVDAMITAGVIHRDPDGLRVDLTDLLTFKA